MRKLVAVLCFLSAAFAVPSTANASHTCVQVTVTSMPVTVPPGTCEDDATHNCVGTGVDQAGSPVVGIALCSPSQEPPPGR